MSRAKTLGCARPPAIPISFPSLHGRERCPTGPPPIETPRFHIHVAETKRGCRSGADASVWLRATELLPEDNHNPGVIGPVLFGAGSGDFANEMPPRAGDPRAQTLSLHCGSAAWIRICRSPLPRHACREGDRGDGLGDRSDGYPHSKRTQQCDEHYNGTGFRQNVGNFEADRGHEV